MARRLERPRKQYALDQCALYALTSCRKLADLLHWQRSVRDLDRFINSTDNYRVFTLKATGRIVQEPKLLLREMHARIANLLRRVLTPDYLHSGVAGRSYISNARQHALTAPTATLDIRKFYASTKWAHVFRFFNSDMRCAPDVAGLLASISCYQHDHVPTGSCLSQVLAFWTFKPLFDAIHEHCVSRGGLMTLYVDDVTATINNVSHGDIVHIGALVERAGLHWGKEKLFRKGRAKLVTGVIARGRDLEAPNRLHKKLGDGLKSLDILGVGSAEWTKAGRSAIGRAQAISQVDKRRRSMSIAVAKVVDRLSRAGAVVS